MGVLTEKPTVREIVAAALSDGSLERAAALGSAQLPRDEDGAVSAKVGVSGEILRHGLDVGVDRDGKDLGLELAALLLRAKYAGDHRGIKLANFRFAVRLRVHARRQVRTSIRSEKIVIALASQSIAEWIADRCERCQGTGLRGARMGGMSELLRPCALCESTGAIIYTSSSVRPDGKVAARAAAFRATALGQSMISAGMGEITIQCPDCRGMRYTMERKRIHHRFGKACQACDGEGDAPPRHADRANALGISLENYTRCWHRWFAWAGSHLTALDKTLVRNLRCELGQGYSPSS